MTRSTSKPPLGEGLTIVADHRERRSGVPALLAGYGLTVEERELPVGDYIIVPGQIAVEWKAPRDLALSIQQRRLFEQAERLKAAFTTPILVVEGPSLYTYTKMSPQALQSALARIMVNPGVSFLRTDSKEDTAAYLLYLARHAVGLGVDPLVSPYKRPARTLDDESLRLVMALPGIGVEVAHRLLAHFGTAAAVFAAGEAELRAVEGIGPTRAARIRATLLHHPGH
ncbi:MAG: ERCC4 domain-containing protein [Anaerolineae bacterium]